MKDIPRVLVLKLEAWNRKQNLDNPQEIGRASKYEQSVYW